MSSLIEKYNISELDLYKLSLIESKKKQANFIQKERLKAASLIILKPYKVSFLDLAKITNEVKFGNFENNPDLQQKYSTVDIEEQISNDSNIGKFYSNAFDTFKSYSKGKKAAIVIGAIALLSFFMKENKHTSSSYSGSSSNKKSDSYEPTAPSFTCKNCGGHSFHYHETVTDMKVCNSCGFGN
jgi:ribosomal protein L37E